MLNFFYMYALIWSAILIFYSFGWSDICTPLAPELLWFFVLTIMISIGLGKMLKKHFKFQRVSVSIHRSRFTVFLIVAFCIVEFVYCRQVPLLFIILGRVGYTEYTGIPTLHSIVIAFSTFYAQYLFYRFLLNYKDKKALIDYGIILTFTYLLQFNRGGLMISAFMSLLMFLAINIGKIRKLINKKTIILAIIALLIVMFGFGALGNMRHGFGFNNSSYIEKLGRFNDKYPSWLPKQFMWAYIYIVSPVANINYNVSMNLAHSNPVGYIMTMFPDFLVRRIYHGEIYAPELVVKDVFNATAGFGTAYMNAGIFGMYFLYFYMMIGLVLLWLNVPIRKEFRMPCLAIMNIIVIFMFFTHTIYYSAISFQLIFPIFSFFQLKTKKRYLLS